MGSNDTVEEFVVTFAVNNFTIDGNSVDNGASGSNVDISLGGQINLGGVQIQI